MTMHLAVLVQLVGLAVSINAGSLRGSTPSITAADYKSLYGHQEDTPFRKKAQEVLDNPSWHTPKEAYPLDPEQEKQVWSLLKGKWHQSVLKKLDSAEVDAGLKFQPLEYKVHTLEVVPSIKQLIGYRATHWEHIGEARYHNNEHAGENGIPQIYGPHEDEWFQEHLELRQLHNEIYIDDFGSKVDLAHGGDTLRFSNGRGDVWLWSRREFPKRERAREWEDEDIAHTERMMDSVFRRNHSDRFLRRWFHEIDTDAELREEGFKPGNYMGVGEKKLADEKQLILNDRAEIETWDWPAGFAPELGPVIPTSKDDPEGRKWIFAHYDKDHKRESFEEKKKRIEQDFFKEDAVYHANVKKAAHKVDPDEPVWVDREHQWETHKHHEVDRR